jgi:phosphoribosylformylglycinamidine synthase
MAAGKLAGRPPPLDAAREKALQTVVRTLIQIGWLSSAHDTSEGGLAVALAECCMADPDRSALGATLQLEPGTVAPHAFVFGEDASRVVVSFPPAHRDAVVDAAKEAGVPLEVVGTVGGDRLTVKGLLDVPVAELSRAWRSGIPAVVKQPAHL